MCDLYDDGGYGTSFGDKYVNACRVDHYCEECGKHIPVGTSYFVLSGIWEGDFFSMKICPRCQRAKSWLLKRGHGWTAGSILHDVRYCVQHELREKGHARAE